MNKVIGYARISSSTGTQILEPQVQKLKESGCDQIFSETISSLGSVIIIELEKLQFWLSVTV